jgi:periplasmic copper chaperone A
MAYLASIPNFGYPLFVRPFAKLRPEMNGGTTMWQKLVGIALLALAGNAWAGSDDVLADNAWLRESVPGQTAASLQLNLTATRPARLLAVSTPLAATVQIQQVSPRPGGVEAHVLRSLSLPRGRAVSFGEHGLSLMLVGLKQPLNVGDHVPVSLTVKLADGQVRKLEVQAEVKPLELSYRHYEQEEVHDH